MLVLGGSLLFLVVLGGSWALVQIVDADDRILTLERTKSVGARGTSATWGACADRRCR